MNNNLRALRSRIGLSQRDLAEQVGASKAHIHRIENGESQPKGQVLTALSDLLGVTAEEIFPGITHPAPGKWCRDEFAVAVDAYVRLWEETQEGGNVNKAAAIRELREGPLSVRSRSSIEYRMQNISAVIREIGYDYLPGYVPAQNVGSNVKQLIRELLRERGIYESWSSEPTSDRDELQKRTEELRHRIRRQPFTGPPTGNRRPAKKISDGKTVYQRDPLVQAWILENANGICELCHAPAPFTRINGEPYLEVHHAKMLAEGGPDTIDNTVAICPTCHTRLHYSIDQHQAREELYERVSRLRR